MDVERDSWSRRLAYSSHSQAWGDSHSQGSAAQESRTTAATAGLWHTGSMQYDPHGVYGTAGLWQAGSTQVSQVHGVSGTGHLCSGQSQRGVYLTRMQAMVISLQQSSTAELSIAAGVQPSSHRQVSPAQAISGSTISTQVSNRMRTP